MLYVLAMFLCGRHYKCALLSKFNSSVRILTLDVGVLPYLNLFDSPNVDSKKEVLLKYIWLLSLRLWEFWTSGTWITQDTSILKRILYWNASYCSGFFWSQRIETQFKEIWNKRALIGTLNKEVQRFSLFEAQLDSLARFW